MQTYLTLVRRELGSHFVSWTGYVVLAGVLFLLGLSTASLLQEMNAQENDMPLMEQFLDTYYFWLVLLLATPILTMRTFALEKFSGTFETLMTAPVGDLEVVLAKFSGAMVLHVLIWVPLFGQMLLFRHYGNDPTVADTGTAASTFLGIVLLGMLYMSMGCLASALTRNLNTAAMIAFALGVSVFVLSYLTFGTSLQPGWRTELYSHISIIEHMRDFARGVVDTRALVFYLSATAVFLFLTLKTVESRRWR
ncbi:MAG: ABC transporter permease subunit [Verrucomicrobia bacterium]|nr:ABC transporter permease subunit [Verrucomicrobiota bacterium]